MARWIVAPRVIAIGAAAVLSACDPAPQQSAPAQSAAPSAQSAASPASSTTVEVAEATVTDSPVLVRVGTAEITQRQLDVSLGQIFSASQVASLDAATRDKALESLVLAKLMAQAAAQSLSADERAELSARVAAHRDQLLVQRYIQSDIQPQPVTAQMIQDYYQANLEKFGGGLAQEVEVLSVRRKLSEDQRQLAVAQFAALGAREDWTGGLGALEQAGLEPHLSRRPLSAVEDARIQGLAANLAVGEPSPLAWFDGKPVMLRVLSRGKTAAKPLAEVSAEIRRTLAPLQLQKALAAERDKLLQETQVEYLTDSR